MNEPLKHDWKTLNEDRYGAVYDCVRCGVSHVVQFNGLDINTVSPTVLDHVCRPKEESKEAR